ncbi:MAG: tetratricopeptide repeat protein, partial [Acidobacteriota bacterium]
RRKDSNSSPMVYYYLGFFYKEKGDQASAAQFAQTASQMPSDYCFPFRLEFIDVLRWAEGVNPGDARAPYYLGNLLFDLQPEKAIAEWEKSIKLDGTFSVVDRNLGLAYGRVKNDVPRAIASLERALALNRADPRLYYELDGFYEAAGVSPQKRLRLLEKNHQIVRQRDDSLSREILLLVQLGQYEKAIRLMKDHHFHVWEGGGEIHDLYVDAHLFLGQDYFRQKKYDMALRYFEAALEFPENLEVGKPFSGGRFPEIYYFIGTAHEARGDAERAREYYEKSAASPRDHSELSYCQGLSLQRLGRVEQANELFDSLIRFAEERLKAGPAADYFAKFGERQSADRQVAYLEYLLGLGYLGRRRTAEAKAEFQKALALDPNHFHAQKRLSWLSQEKDKNRP